MPWVVRKSPRCPATKPWGVFVQASGAKVACHETQAQAKAQQRALYAAERKA